MCNSAVSRSSSKSNTRRITIAAVLLSVLAVLIVAFVLSRARRRTAHTGRAPDEALSDKLLEESHRQFAATYKDCFSNKHLGSPVSANLEFIQRHADGLHRVQVGSVVRSMPNGTCCVGKLSLLDESRNASVFIVDQDADLDAKIRFLAECRLLAVLTHANILPVLAWSTFPRLLMCSTPQTHDLRTFLKACRPTSTVKIRDISLEDLSQMITQLASACTFLATRSVLHGDLRADNVFINAEGILTPQLGNFLVSRADRNDENDYKYLSPEVDELAIEHLLTLPQTLESNVYTIPSEVYSFGSLCWEVVFIRLITSAIDTCCRFSAMARCLGALQAARKFSRTYKMA